MTKFFVITVITILIGTLCLCLEINIDNEIIEVKNAAESAINDSKSSRADILLNYTSYFRNIKDSEFKDFNATVDEAYKNIRSNIAAAEKEGKHANHCLKTMESQMGDSQKKVYDEMDSYVLDAVSFFNISERYLDKFLKGRESRLSNVDGRLANCMNLKQIEMNNCMSQQLVAARESINFYKRSARRLIKGVRRMLMWKLDLESDVLKSRMRNVKFSISKAKEAADKCIQNS